MNFIISVKKELKRFFQKQKILIVISILAIVLFSITFVFSEKIIHSVRPLIKSEISKTEEALNQELVYISEQTKEIVDSGILNENIKNKDILTLLSLLNDQIKKRNLDVMIVTDKDGIVLTRTQAIEQRGDNIFQTTAWGRILSKGKDITFIEKGRPLPLVLVSCYPIKEDEELIGSVCSAYSMNDKYAIKFKKKYLFGWTELAFYSKEEGIIGATFENPKTTDILNTYFGIGSDLIVKDLSELKNEVNIEGENYLIKNIIFPGIEKSPGGVFIFCRSPHSLQGLSFGIAIIILFLFLLKIIILFPSFNYSVNRNKYIRILIISSIFLFLIIAFISINKLDKGTIELKKPVYPIYNSVIKFEPEVDVIDKSFKKYIKLKLFSGGEAINVVGVEIDYDPQIAKVLEINTTKSFCQRDFFIEKSIDNENGKVEIACMLPSPGFMESNGVIAELILQPLKSGKFILHFGKETQVLANDGLGTNVLRLAVDGSYDIINYNEEEEFVTPRIFSYTHPNSERWYQKRDIKFSWNWLEETSRYRYAFNKIADYIPEEENFTQDNFLRIDVNKDGIYYFHVAEEKENGIGSVSHYKIMIDSTPPFLRTIKVSNTDIDVGEIVRFVFSGQDELSGIQDVSYIKINDGIFLPVKQSVYIPFLQRGENIVTIRIFDKAGNFDDTQVRIKVGKK